MNTVKTQSMLKDIEAFSTCPERFRRVWIDEEQKSDSSLAMNKGSFFEYLAIGAGAIHGEDVTDLPRKKITKVQEKAWLVDHDDLEGLKGEKYADQIRIEAQAEKFKTLFDPKHKDFLGYKIKSVQVKLESDDGEGTIDFACKDANGALWIVDLKLTQDLTNDFGPYQWADLSRRDFTQQIWYRHLFKEQFGISDVKMAVMVFDYHAEMRSKWIPLEISDASEYMVLERFQQANSVAEKYKANGYPVNPSKKECEGCTADCLFRWDFPDIDVEEIRI